MAKLTLSVVRVKDRPDIGPFEESCYATDPFYTRLSVKEQRRLYSKSLVSWFDHRGLFIKSGGGYTEELQEAQVFGWAPGAKRNLLRYSPKLYEIIPIQLTITQES